MNIIKVMKTGLMLLFSTAIWAAGDVNTADASAFAAELKGVGEKKALAIISYRSEHGAFKNSADLANVKGISVKTIEKNKEKEFL